MPSRSTEVAEGVHRLGTPWVNWFVLEEGGRLTVIDAGYPRHRPQLIELVGRMGRELGHIDAVLITHCHPDHLGVAEWVRAEAGVSVHVHDAEAGDARNGGRTPSIARMLPLLRHRTLRRYMLRTVREGGLRIPPVADVTTMTDGEVVDVPGRPRVLHTPGHTPGSCALFCEERSVLFSGDALVTWSTTTGRHGPTLLPPPFTADPDAAYRSLEVLEGTGAQHLLPGHGEPWHYGVSAAVEAARRGAGRA